MTLELNILLLMLIFILFSLFIYCYGSEERKKNRELGYRSYPTRPYEFSTNPPINTRVSAIPPNPNPNNIGFNITDEAGPSTAYAPVGAAPGVHSCRRGHTTYPARVQPPYPVVKPSAFPSPVTTALIQPSAPTQDSSEPPSYYEATGHQ